ncbi:MFS general substrate transporter [Daldinia loculata]|uniref:MFS general substrate transporter n=1 Tax=Daldinia loculata TaxID=103429 RepID=UPI0020C4B45C|nr:MFS general substrate transporter [Daldinia loculata]KAI1650287.1 MFS general substrate transporter [Daldinia loculata]KAI2779791.1 MFS general substrate transporter [Daldinia loculata]
MTLFRRKKQQQNLDEIATQPSVFDDPEKAKYFQPTEKYENLHRFDPSARWTWAEELPLINKLDWKITLWACIAFFALDLDRGNLSQANTDNFLEDLGLSTNDYNLGNTIFRLAFLCAELPSQLVSKKVGPDRWIPTIMVLWSIVAASQFWLNSRETFLACRVLLGLLQGGFIPDIVLYLSYFFKASELPFRLALFWTTLKVVDIIAPILAFGILRLRGHRGQEGWRWLFLIEGVFTLSVGVWSWFMMAPSPTQTKAWYRPKGWFNEREEIIMVNRILRDDPSKGDMHNRQAVDLKRLWKSLCDYDLWPIYIAGLVFGIPVGPPDQYLTLTLRDLGFDTFNSNLLSIPSQVLGIVTMLTLTYLSEVWNERSFMGMLAQIWILPNIIALAVIPSNTSPWARYAIVIILLSYPYPHAIQVGWCSRNSNTVRARTVSAAAYNMFVQVSGIAYSNIYRADDKPEYRRGNKQLVAICAANIVIYILIKVYYIYRNKQRDTDWNAMTREEQIHYLETTTDQGSKRKDFRFAH